MLLLGAVRLGKSRSPEAMKQHRGTLCVLERMNVESVSNQPSQQSVLDFKKTPETFALGAPHMGRALVHPARPCLMLKEAGTSHMRIPKKKTNM